MRALADGELDAAAVLFRRYQVPLFNFFLRLGFAREMSEDLTQTVFERVIKYRQSYREGMSFRTWIYQIARNVKADAYRQQQAFLWEPLQPERLESLAHSTVDTTLDDSENLARLDRSLAQLPENQLEILLLTRYQQLKYTEVAELLGCSEGAVKVKVFRALQQLRNLFFALEKQ